MRLAYKSNLLLIMGTVGVLLLSGCNSGGGNSHTSLSSNSQIGSEAVVIESSSINNDGSFFDKPRMMITNSAGSKLSFFVIESPSFES